jgi:hypothetical protein
VGISVPRCFAAFCFGPRTIERVALECDHPQSCRSPKPSLQCSSYVSPFPAANPAGKPGTRSHAQRLVWQAGLTGLTFVTMRRTNAGKSIMKRGQSKNNPRALHFSISNAGRAGSALVDVRMTMPTYQLR